MHVQNIQWLKYTSSFATYMYGEDIEMGATDVTDTVSQDIDTDKVK